jgi:hypothetical protein
VKAGTTAAAGSLGSRGSRVVEATVAAGSVAEVTAASAAAMVAEVTASGLHLSPGVCLPLSGAMQSAHQGNLHKVVCDALCSALATWVPPTPSGWPN